MKDNIWLADSGYYIYNTINPCMALLAKPGSIINMFLFISVDLHKWKGQHHYDMVAFVAWWLDYES